MLLRIGALMVLLHVGACSRWLERQTLEATTSVMERSKAAMKQESDVDLARAATPAGIKTLEGFFIAYPNDRALRALVAEAVCQYGAGLLQDDWEAAALAGELTAAESIRQRARAILARCVGYGLLLLDSEWSAALWSRDAAFDRLVAGAGRSQITGMFWVALGLGATIGMFPEDLELGARLPQVELLLARVIELDEGFQDGLAHITLGILWSARSAAVGGDPERGRAHFDRARALSGGRNLMSDVMYARYYAVTTRDRRLFHDTLRAVLGTPASIWPENRLSNEIAQRKARRYLAHERRWF